MDATILSIVIAQFPEFFEYLVVFHVLRRGTTREFTPHQFVVGAERNPGAQAL